MSLPLASFSALHSASGHLGAAPQSNAHERKMPAVTSGFADAMDQASMGQGVRTKSERMVRDLAGFGRIEIVRVTETRIDADGKTATTVKELAVCPECGTINCSCMARITLQTRLDEENAKGPRDRQLPSLSSPTPVPVSLAQLMGQGGLNSNPSPLPRMLG